jgi:creatinine amidohydrolase
MSFPGVNIGEATWAGKSYAEILDIAEQDGSVLIMPVGSIEQHGDHMPTATDTILVDAIANGGAERAIDEIPVVVTPTVWTGFSPHHMSIGGTITAEFENILAIIEDIADSALDNGFDALLLINGHGGNSGLVKLGSPGVIGKKHLDVEVLGLNYFSLGNEFIDEIRESDKGGMGHAGEFETSLMMHLQPQLVDENSRNSSYMDEPYDLHHQDMFESGRLTRYREIGGSYESGAIGDAEIATAEKGKELFDRFSDELSDLLIEIHENNSNN